MRIRVVATVALIILAVLVVYVFLTVGFVEELEVSLRSIDRKDDGDLSISVLVVDLLDGWKRTVGGIYMESIDHEGSPSTLLRVVMWHAEGTRLDSLSIAFESSLQFEVFPAFDRSPSLELRRSEEGGAVVFNAPDLGFEARREVVFEFYVTPTLAEPLELNLRFEITMQDEGIVTFRRMEAEAVAMLTMRRE